MGFEDLTQKLVTCKQGRGRFGAHAMMALLPLVESNGMTAKAYVEVAKGIFSSMAL